MSTDPQEHAGAPEGTLVPHHAPWPRLRLSRDAWAQAAQELGSPRWTLLGLWGEPRTVHMAVLDEQSGRPLVWSCDCPDGRFPSVARHFLPALRLERTIRDLFGLEPEDAQDERPWLDHGQWGLRAPLGVAPSRPEQPARPASEYRFLPAEGESLHQIPVGPVHAGIIEPGHFRFHANGEAVVRLEQRLGYVHKGIEALLAGAEPAHAARLAGRVSGDSTVAYALSFARAVEAAASVAVPERAVWLRALMAELERVANHLGDIGAICNDAAFAIVHANFAMLREQVLRACADCFGHRLMMDRVVPGGVAVDLAAEGVERLRALLALLRPRFHELVQVYDNSPSMLERAVGTGILRPELARLFGAGGYVGRASLRGFDARKQPGYPPYERLQFEVPVLNSGDVNARVWVRIKEVQQSLSLLEQMLDALPVGPALAPWPAPRAQEAEGMALVEGFRGDVLAWVRLGPDGRIARCHLRDPSWFQWPLLEAAIEGNIVADFPLCNKSFNCSYSGHDL
jgi:Ni,Fe-hydrogenase III large subunit